MEIIKAKYSSNRTKIYACCPFCVNIGKKPDTKYHLYITPYKAVYCFRCGYKSSYDSFISKFQFNVDVAGLVPVASVVPDGAFDKFIKENTCDLSDSTYACGARTYLRSRGLTDYLIEKFNIKLGSNRLFGRVVFLDEINKYYVARSFLPNLKPKTLNPTSAVRPLMYYNDNGARTIHLVEGCFDLTPIYLYGYSGFALLGKDISAYQISQLLKLDMYNVVVCLDADAQDAANKLARRIADAMPYVNVGVRYFTSRCDIRKDPSDYGHAYFKSTDILWYRMLNIGVYDE